MLGSGPITNQVQNAGLINTFSMKYSKYKLVVKIIGNHNIMLVIPSARNWKFCVYIRESAP